LYISYNQRWLIKFWLFQKKKLCIEKFRSFHLFILWVKFLATKPLDKIKLEILL
jgi:hypothetical protein